MTNDDAGTATVDRDRKTEVATLGGGCFWCLEAVFQEVRGVGRVVSGYAGGTTENPTYEQVCSGATGHAEVVQVHFDPSVVTYADLLRVFFVIHDPTTRDRQGADVGPQYRSVILWSSDRQRAEAEALMAELEASGAYGDPLVTELAPLTTFYEAEAGHQDFRRRNPGQPYCRIVIDPKLARFRRLFADLRRVVTTVLVAFMSAAFALSPSTTMAQDLISTRAMLAAPPVEADRRIEYGPESEQFADLYLPDGDGPFPVVVLIHGGCWRSIAGAGYTSHLAEELTTFGWAVWNLEFRRIDQPGGAWPGILDDVRAGALHLRAVAAEYALDLDRVVTAGHSSGGHLALWLASELEPLQPVRGVVALAAIADLQDFHARTERGCGSGIVPALLGGDPLERADRMRRASPAERLPLGVRQLLVTGREDRTVPLAHTEAYAERARRSGDTVEILAVPRAGHFEVVAPWSPAFDAVRARMRAFLGTQAGGH